MSDFYAESLLEAIELLQEDNSRYRRSNVLLRKINSQLRHLLNRAHENDENFKSFCSEPTEYVLDIETYDM